MGTEFTKEDVKDVFDKLDNPKYEWRTIEGISKEAGIDPHIVQKVLRAKGNKIIKSAYLSNSGEELYTTRRKFKKSSSFLKKMIGAVKSRAE